MIADDCQNLIVRQQIRRFLIRFRLTSAITVLLGPARSGTIPGVALIAAVWVPRDSMCPLPNVHPPIRQVEIIGHRLSS